MELVRDVRPIGNSSGVLLPRAWLGGKARVQLIKEPRRPEEEALDLFAEYLPQIEGLYLVGSHARGEADEQSDLDIVAITSVPLKLQPRGDGVHVVTLTRREAKRQLQSNAIPLLPMLREAKPLINLALLTELRQTPLTPRNIRPHLELTASALDVSEAFLEELDDNDLAPEAAVYSLVLRLRGVYLVDCLIRRRKSSEKQFKKLAQSLTGSPDAYLAHRALKHNREPGRTISIRQARSILDYVRRRIARQREWAERRN